MSEWNPKQFLVEQGPSWKDNKIKKLEAEFEKLVRYVRALRMDSGDLGMYTQVLRKKTNEAWQALSDETRKAIEEKCDHRIVIDEGDYVCPDCGEAL